MRFTKKNGAHRPAKRPIRFLTTLIALAVFFAGCGGNGGTQPPGPGTEPGAVTAESRPDDSPAGPEEMMDVLDADGVRIGGIGRDAAVTAVDGGLFYSVSARRENAFTATAEYRFFRLEDGSDHLLGRMEDQGYEAAFARTELDGIVYALAVKGDPFGSSPTPLLLLAFDPGQETMKTVTVTETGFPYVSMCSSGGSLLIMSHETSAGNEDRIYRYDPASEKVEEVLSFSSSADSLRAVCAADGGFYLLRLKVNAGGANEMFLDRYDLAGTKVSEQSVNDLLADAAVTIEGIQDRQDALMDMGTNVSRLEVIDGRYMVYENFGRLRLIVDLQDGKTLLAKIDLYSVSQGTGSPVVFRLGLDPETDAQPEIWGMDGGIVRPVIFRPADSRCLIESVSRSASGTWAVGASDTFPWNAGSKAVTVWTE